MKQKVILNPISLFSSQWGGSSSGSRGTTSSIIRTSGVGKSKLCAVRQKRPAVEQLSKPNGRNRFTIQKDPEHDDNHDREDDDNNCLRAAAVAKKRHVDGIKALKQLTASLEQDKLQDKKIQHREK